MKQNAFINRLIIALKVKCKLQHQQPSSNNEIQCEWTGFLGDLQQHIENYCPFYEIKCKECDKLIKRHQLDAHLTEEIPCDKCEIKVMRKNMKAHIEICPQKWLSKKGNMIAEHRKIVAEALIYCQQHDKLNS